MRRFLLFLFYGIAALSAFAQHPIKLSPIGLPPMSRYSAADYQGNDVVWDVIQDNRGVIYIATSTGIHEFDGINWRSVEGLDVSGIKCMAKNEDGRIYVGTYEELGFLGFDAKGNLRFQSLKHLVHDSAKISNIVEIKCSEDKVFFASMSSVLSYDQSTQSIDYHETDTWSFPSFFLNGKPHFRLWKKGMYQLEGDSLVPAGKTNYFQDIIFTGSVAATQDSIILLDKFSGLHVYTSDTAYKLSQLEDPDLQADYAYKLIQLSPDYLAISYLQSGIVILNQELKPILKFNKELGLENEVYNLFIDRENNLWASTISGVGVVELSSAHTVIDERQGLQGACYDFEEVNDQLFLATTAGVYSSTWPFGYQSKFKKIDGTETYNDVLLTTHDGILVKCATSAGVIKDNKYQKIIIRSSYTSSMVLLGDTTLALTTGDTGKTLELLEYQQGQWRHKSTLESRDLPDKITYMQYDPVNNVIWANNDTQIFSITLSADAEAVVSVQYFDESSGLPTNANALVREFDYKVLFLTSDGPYEYNSSARKFIKSDMLNDFFSGKPLEHLARQKDSTVWYMANFEIADIPDRGLVRRSDDSIIWDNKMTNVLPRNLISIYSTTDQGTFLSGYQQIFYFDDLKSEQYGFAHKPLLRRLEVTNNQDSAVFTGSFIQSDSTYSFDQEMPIVLNYSQNNLIMTAAVPYYRHPGKIQYQFKLDGFDENWSDWDSKNTKEYTNLPQGDFTFLIKAKNGFDVESLVGSVMISISPPWYFTIWAYGLYAFVTFILLMALLRANSARLRKKNEQLEKVISERTAKIQQQNEVISRNLKEREALLKEIHHRVKNNLQIIANLLYLQSGKFDDEKIKNVLEEGQGRVRSMALIHQKLYENEDLKSIPFGEYVLELVNEIKASFGDQMSHVQVKVNATEAYFDVDSAVPLGLIINELTTNAFKYAFQGREEGQFSIYLTKSGSAYVLHVSDDGNGIPEEIDIRKTRSLGLRLVRILSEQLEGEYSFEKENGMNFKLKFVA